MRSGRFFKIFVVLGIVAASSGHADSRPDFHFTAPLRSVLLNPTELQKAHADAGLQYYPSCSPRLSNPEPLCRFLGSECLIVDFTDSPSKIHPYDGYKDPAAKTHFNSVPYPGQLELDQFALDEDERNGGPFSHRLLQTSSYERKIHATKLFNVDFLEQRAHDLLQENWKQFKAGEIPKDRFVQSTLGASEAYSWIPALYKDADRQDLVAALDELSAKALILALDALVATADYENDTYPYADQLVTPDSMLPVSRLYENLNFIGRWPKFENLSPDKRAALGGVYQEHSVENRWKVKGFYDEDSNALFIDYSNGFYENVYVLYHELWHVAWAHSKLGQSRIEKIVSLLNGASSPEQEQSLRSSLLKFISENEFLAIDQQIRLFHATGIQTGGWAGGALVGSQGWHDSYFGTDYYKLLIQSRFRSQLPPKWAFLPPVAVIPGLWKRHEVETLGKQELEFIRTLDDGYWKQQLTRHASVFESAYFGAPLGLDEAGIGNLEASLISEMDRFQLRSPSFPTLSCAQLSAIRGALGQDWKFGIPFHYQLSDPTDCDDEDKDKPIHPSNEGTHSHIANTISLPAPTLPSIPTSSPFGSVPAKPSPKKDTVRKVVLAEPPHTFPSLEAPEVP